jgi:nitrite reductase (NADH) small subunit
LPATLPLKVTPVLVRACDLDDLPEGTGTMVELQGECIALFRAGVEVRAVDNDCPHRGGALSGGSLHGGAVHCPLHDWPFDARSGICLERPDVRVRTFPVVVRGGAVFVEL